MLFTYPLMAAIQEISARIGRVTGRGIAGNIRAALLAPGCCTASSACCSSPTSSTSAPISARWATRCELLIGGPAPALCRRSSAALCAALEIFVQLCALCQRSCKWLTLSLFAYVATAFVVDVPWGEVALGDRSCRSSAGDADYIVAHRRRAAAPPSAPISSSGRPRRRSRTSASDPRCASRWSRRREQAPAEIRRIRIDTYVGMASSNLSRSSSSSPPPRPCTRMASPTSRPRRRPPRRCGRSPAPSPSRSSPLGIIGTGLLAVPVLAGSAAYALGEALGWPRRPRAQAGARPRPSTARSRSRRWSASVINFIADRSDQGAVLERGASTASSPCRSWSMMMLMARQPRVMGHFSLPLPLRRRRLARHRRHGRGGRGLGRHLAHGRWLRRRDAVPGKQGAANARDIRTPRSRSARGRG